MILLLPNGLTFTKRRHDQRIMSLDVSGKLREGDTVRSFASIRAVVHNSSVWEHPAPLVVEIAEKPISDDGSVLYFNCSGGDAGVTYQIIARYVPETEARLESIAYVWIL